MPLIASTTITSVIDRSGPERIVLPVHAGRRGHPVAFGTEFFADLMTLSGDRGAASVIDRNRDVVVEVPVSDPGIHADADTRDALTELRVRMGQPTP
jgi:molybdenum cofactor cytidylyltransferase